MLNSRMPNYRIAGMPARTLLQLGMRVVPSNDKHFVTPMRYNNLAIVECFADVMHGTFLWLLRLD